MVGLVAAALLAGFLFMPKGSSDLEEEKVETGDITTFYSFSGTVEAKNRKTMMSDAAMQIKEIEVKVGERVEKGDVLMTTLGLCFSSSNSFRDLVRSKMSNFLLSMRGYLKKSANKERAICW